VRRLVVVRIEEGQQPYVDVVQGRQRADEVEAALAQGAPEALHLPATLWAVGLGVHQRRFESRASGGQRVAAVGAAVVEVQGVGLPMPAQRAHEEAQHVHLALGVVGLERHDVARRVVHEGVDAQRPALPVDAQAGAVADVAVPQRHRPRRLPAQPRLARGGVAQADSVEARLLEETAQCRRRQR
jgi:hypothetical protein